MFCPKAIMHQLSNILLDYSVIHPKNLMVPVCQPSYKFPPLQCCMMENQKIAGISSRQSHTMCDVMTLRGNLF